MRKAFSLLELLVVIGIMGTMAAIAIGGYQAVNRGMAERAALDAAAGVTEIAFQRAKIDRTRTYLYLFDEVTRLETDDKPGIVCGVAIAVRPVGRITRVSGDEFYDEFGDLNQSYNELEDGNLGGGSESKSSNVAGMRIYSISGKNFMTVQESVCRSSGYQEPDLEENSTARNIGEFVFGFKKVDGSATLSVGEEYGQEFSVMRLPPGFTFGQSVNMSSAQDLGMKQVGSVLTIDPTSGAAPSVTVYRRQPDGTFKSIGTTSGTKDIKRN